MFCDHDNVPLNVGDIVTCGSTVSVIERLIPPGHRGSSRHYIGVRVIESSNTRRVHVGKTVEYWLGKGSGVFLRRRGGAYTTYMGLLSSWGR
jgi:predicted RecA/RadA family phage recombinase